MSAIIPLFFPYRWMQLIHQEWLGLGTLPDIPILHYLNRSLSALYALSGFILYYVTFDINKYKGLIKIGLCARILFGVTTTAIAYESGLPCYWMLLEGPTIAILCLLGLNWLKPH